MQKDAQRLMYLHVPSAWLAYLAFFVTALASALFLWPRTRSLGLGPPRRRVGRARRAVHRADARARLALGQAGLGRLVGVGRPPRHDRRPLLPLPRLPRAAAHPGGDPIGSAKRNAIAALIAFVDVPIVHFSVEWWRTLHQKATVFNPQLSAKIDGVMALTLWLGVIAFTLLYVYLLDRRYRLASLEDELDERELEAAIAERIGAPP